VRRVVEIRDHHRCVVPGCRSSIGLHLHHIVDRAEGGTHEPEMLCVLCDLCRARHNEHYAAWLVMPRSAALSDGDLAAYAA
jgi:hypothetical protein